MNNTELALPTGFKEVMRENILKTFMGMIPQEKIDALVEAEVKAFFETEMILTIEQTKITVDNPNYQTTSGQWNNSDRKMTKECLAFGSKMTPFRQLVWSTIHEAIAPKLKALVHDSNSEVNKELNKWLLEQVKPEINANFQSMFTQTAVAMSSTMFTRAMKEATVNSNLGMMNSLQNMGIKPEYPSVSMVTSNV